jgi:phosphonate transport system substrate-binding protein
MGALSRGAAGFLAIAAVATLGCGSEPPRQRIQLTREADPSDPVRSDGSNQVLRVGVASVLSPRSSLRHYRDLVEYLGERLGMRTEMVQRSSYAEMNELLRQRYCMVGMLCNYAYVRANRDFGARPLAAPQVGGEPTYRAYIIVRRDAPIRSLEDLAGRRFAYADPMCDAGWLFPRFLVLRSGRPEAEFFRAAVFTYDYENSIRAVAEGMMDAAGVESPLYDWLVAQKDPAALKTKVLVRSPLLGTPPVVVHPDLDAGLRERIRGFFLSLHEDERGRGMLAGMMVERFVEVDPKLYAPVSGMAKAVERP